MAWYGWRPYVPVAVRRARALKEMTRLRKKGVPIEEVRPRSRNITETFWGRAWCDHLEQFSDFANRLPGDSDFQHPASIGEWKILGVLGQGGMGIVYRAEQGRPKRSVALKVIRPGVSSKNAMRRFQYESEALARLQHPGIAQVFRGMRAKREFNGAK